MNITQMRKAGWRSFFTFLGFVIVVGAIGVESAVIAHEKTSPIEPSRSLWKPSKAVKLNDDVFCFQAEDGECRTTVCAKTVLCTFDGGATVVSVEANLPYCGDHGVVVDGQLHCAGEQVSVPNATYFTFSVVTFSAKDSKLVASLAVDKQLTFDFPKAAKTTFKTLEFTGTSLAVDDDGATTFVLPLTAVDDNGTKTSVVYSSKDGFDWKYLSDLPFVSPSTALHTVQLGRRKIGVVSRTVNGTFERATSNYLGRWWSDVKPINSTAPPFSVFYPSSLTVHYSVTNTTSLSASYHAEDFPKLGQKTVSLTGQPLATSQETENAGSEKPTSSYAVAYQPTSDRVLAIHDVINPKGKKQLQMSSFVVNDTEERTLEREEREREAKKKAEADAAREKAQKERQERLAKERREEREREHARRKAFKEADAPNIELALKNYEIDGDYIVVRRSQKETLDLEKSAFFW